MVEEFFKILPTNTEENDYVIVCGNVQASKEHFKTVKAAQEYINTKPWDLIFTISYAAHKALNAQKTEKIKKIITILIKVLKWLSTLLSKK